MTKVSKKYFLYGVITGLFIVIIAVLLMYQIPSVKSSLDWRLDVLSAFIRGVINPVSTVPTAESNHSLISQNGNEGNDIPIIKKTSTEITPKIEMTYTPTIELTPIPTTSDENNEIPERVILDSPNYEAQDWNNCGPVTLTHYLRYYGWDGDQHDISDQIKPLRADRNVNVDELVQYVSENVWWLSSTYRVGGDLTLLKKFIASGIPVMIEESFYLEDRYWFNDDRWSGHYLLVTGYDDNDEIFIVQDPLLGPDRKISYLELDNNWQSFNRVYILVYPEENTDLTTSILGEDWDIDTNRENALDRSISNVQKLPDNPYAWFNYGTNLIYFDGYDEAAVAYDTAREIGLPQRMFRYQFGPFLAYFHSGRLDELETIVDYALQITPNSEEALLWNGWLSFRLGKKQKALSLFQEALEKNPNYTDAAYAIEYALNN